MWHCLAEPERSEPEPLHHPIECRAVDAERACRLRALAARAVERGADARRGGTVEHVLQRAVGGGRRAGAPPQHQVPGRDRAAAHPPAPPPPPVPPPPARTRPPRPGPTPP